jgi:hypothetical protein
MRPFSLPEKNYSSHESEPHSCVLHKMHLLLLESFSAMQSHPTDAKS